LAAVAPSLGFHHFSSQFHIDQQRYENNYPQPNKTMIYHHSDETMDDRVPKPCGSHGVASFDSIDSETRQMFACIDQQRDVDDEVERVSSMTL
jgi:hypothetical protein